MFKKITSLLLACLLTAGVLLFATSCGSKGSDPATPGTTIDIGTGGSDGSDDTNFVNTHPTVKKVSSTEIQVTSGEIAADDGTYTTYNLIGNAITLEDVMEDENGIAYVEYNDGIYELGLDFLSMAMVYGCSSDKFVGEFDTAEKVYSEWWRLYIQRWNYLLPELPLYTNEVYDLYNSEIKNYETNPYWGTTSALLYCTTTNAKNQVIVGSSTDLTGSFRFPSLGVSSPSGADTAVSKLVNGYATVTTNKNGELQWDSTVVKEHSEVENADGSKTFTITINDDLVFSDGSAITAKNYIVETLAFSTPLMKSAVGKDHMAGMSYVGYDNFSTATSSTPFTGIRLLDDYTFSVTVSSSYIPYYYEISYASFSPSPIALWINGADVRDDGDGAYLTSTFYSYTKDQLSSYIGDSKYADVSSFPFSGPYVVTEYDGSTKQATLTLNPLYKGNYEGQKPSIQTIVYTKVVSETQLQSFTNGEVDIISEITGGDATHQAIAAVEDSNGKYSYTKYDRAGYGKMQFRSDFGPTMFTEVRQAIAYMIDRNNFSQTFTGGFGSVINGPYYAKAWMYEEVKSVLNLTDYEQSVIEAVEVLTEGGWIYNSRGELFVAGTDDVRYKKLTAEEATADNIKFASQDNAYRTVKIGDDYYMPLCINWFCTEDNEVSELLKSMWAEKTAISSQLGMYIKYTQGTFTQMLGEFYHYSGYGWSGASVYNVFNFATSYSSAIYDYAYNWSWEDKYYDNYSIAYLKDSADYITVKDGVATQGN